MRFPQGLRVATVLTQFARPAKLKSLNPDNGVETLRYLCVSGFSEMWWVS